MIPTSIVPLIVRSTLLLVSTFLVFIACLLIWISSNNQCTERLVGLQGTETNYLLLKLVGIYLVAAASLGLYGSYYMRKGSVYWFSRLSFLSLLFVSLVLVLVLPRLDQNSQVVKQSLQQLQANYNWEPANNANQRWDQLQTKQHCCGISSPDDWAAFRPARPPADEPAELPFSCCRNASLQNSFQYCHVGMDIWTEGCLSSLFKLNGALFGLLVALIWLHMMTIVVYLFLICTQDSALYFN